jgi:hypothetical protein
MPRTADFHDQIADPRLSQATGVVDDATALHPAVDVLDTHATAGNAPIRGFLRAREGPAPRLLGRHDHLDMREHKRQKAQLLEQPAACGQRVRGRLGHPLIVNTARIGVTQTEDRERGVDQQHVFDGVALVLAAITARRLNRILGALETPFGAIVTKRGEAGAGVGVPAGGSAGLGGAGVGTTIALASASATPRRCASFCTDRLGASPRPPSVARRTTKRP